MIPHKNDALGTFVLEEQPSLTYRMDAEENRMVTTCDGIPAIQQAIYKILNTERYDCPIYSRGYGVELKTLFGKPVSYCMSEMERQIREALLQDDRIIGVDGFTFEQPEKGVLKALFQVRTSKGSVTAEKEVRI